MKDIILKGLESISQEEEIVKAKGRFRNFSPKMMRDEYNKSGMSPEEILKRYGEFEEKRLRAIEFVKGLYIP